MDESLRVAVLDREISRLSMQGAQAACLEAIATGKGGYACFANVHTVTESTRHPELAIALKEARFAFADGVPLLWVAKLKGKPIASRVCGPDFMREILLSTQDQTHGFIGGAPGVAEGLAKKYGIKRAACYSPPMRAFTPAHARLDWAEFLKHCEGGKPPAHIWVGLGAPKQELWCHTISPLAPTSMFYAVGAAFDFLTDSKPRAPLWMQNNGLEWAFRLASEPKRLWKRYLVTNSLFVLLVTRDLISRRKNSL